MRTNLFKYKATLQTRVNFSHQFFGLVTWKAFSKSFNQVTWRKSAFYVMGFLANSWLIILKCVESSAEAKFALLSEINPQNLICAASKLSYTPVWFALFLEKLPLLSHYLRRFFCSWEENFVGQKVLWKTTSRRQIAVFHASVKTVFHIVCTRSNE